MNNNQFISKEELEEAMLFGMESLNVDKVSMDEFFQKVLTTIEIAVPGVVKILQAASEVISNPVCATQLNKTVSHSADLLSRCFHALNDGAKAALKVIHNDAENWTDDINNIQYHGDRLKTEIQAKISLVDKAKLYNIQRKIKDIWKTGSTKNMSMSES